MTAAGAKTEKEPVVIVVDDDPSFRMFLSRLVQTIGLKSILFTSAEEFLAARQPDGPACLVLDVQMPGMDGYQTTEAIREFEKKHKRNAVKIVGMTAHASLKDRDKCLKSGMNDYLSKPFDPAKLQTILQHSMAA